MKNLKIPRAALAFACLWLFIALFPPTREILRAFPAWTGVFGGSAFDLPVARFDQLARQTPADPTVLAWKQEIDLGGATRGAAFQRALGEMDALSARFPADLSLPAQRLRLSLWKRVAIRTREEAQRAAPPKSQWLGDEDFALASRIAQKAEAREPDNAFWPWMDAVFCFARRQNEAGIAGLERASKCARFDDYSAHVRRARMKWFQNQANPLWEEKLGLFFNTPFPPIEPMRNTVLAATLDATRARKSGDNARAARLETAILGACRVWQRSENDIVVRVSRYAARQSLEKLLEMPAPKPPPLTRNGSTPYIDPAIHLTQLTRAWAAFARQNGRAEWSRNADFLIPGATPDAASEFLHRDLWREFGLPAPWGRIAVAAPPLLMILAALCWVGASIWLIGGLATRIAARATKNPAPETIPTRGEVALCANFSLWAFLGAALVFLRWFWGTPFDVFSASAMRGEATGMLALGLVLWLGIWLLPVTFAGWKRGHRVVRVYQIQASEKEVLRPVGRAPRALWWGIFLIFGIATLTDGRGLWDGTPFQSPSAFFIAAGAAIVALALEIVRFRRSGRTLGPRFRIEKTAAAPGFEPVMLRLLRAGVWLLCPALLLVAINNLPPFWGDRIVMLVPFFLVLFCAVWLERKGARRADFTRAWQLAARSAGVLSLVWSVIFLGLCLGLWPLRAQLNHQLDRRLQIGENAWMREQVAAAAPLVP